MIDAGREKLKRETDGYVQYNGGLPTPELSEYVLRENPIDAGAVILGASVLSVNDTIWDRQVDLNVLRTRLMDGFRGTAVVPGELTEEGKRVSGISHQEQTAMIQAACEDKTLSIFFKNPYTLLPRKLRNYICEAKGLSYIDGVLPQYEVRAKLLVA